MVGYFMVEVRVKMQSKMWGSGQCQDDVLQQDYNPNWSSLMSNEDFDYIFRQALREGDFDKGCLECAKDCGLILGGMTIVFCPCTMYTICQREKERNQAEETAANTVKARLNERGFLYSAESIQEGGGGRNGPYVPPQLIVRITGRRF